MTTKETPEPQNVDWDGLYKIRDKCSGRVLDKLNHWLYANDPRKAGNNPVEQTPPPIDVEALKREAPQAMSFLEISGFNYAIDHLHSHGYLPELQEVAGLREAVMRFEFDFANVTEREFEALQKAARLYLELLNKQKGQIHE